MKLVAWAASVALLCTAGPALADRTENPGTPPPPAELNGRYLVTAPSSEDPTTGAINWDIFTMDLDGSDRRQLTDSPASDQIASWSRDGRKIAFSTYRTGEQTLWVMDADGRDERQVSTATHGTMAPSWSPDGTKIAYMSTSQGNQIFVLDIETRRSRQLTFGQHDQYPTWSPDGTRIAYSTTRPGTHHRDIVVVDTDGTDPVNITAQSSPNWGFHMAAWSPDGRWIAAQSEFNDIVLIDPEGDGSRIKTVAVGSEQLPGATCTGTNSEPSWAPDSQVLIYRACRGLRIVNVDGTGERIVLSEPGGGNHGWPDWQPKSCSPTGRAAPGATPMTKGVTQVCGAIPVEPPSSTTSTTTTTAPDGGPGSGPGPSDDEPPAPPADPAVVPATGSGPPRRSGYWAVTRSGVVYAFGDARHFGNASGGSGIVDLEPTPLGSGYWIVDEQGRVSIFGDARPFGAVEQSMLRSGERVTSLSATGSGRGYWIFTSDGRVFAFGDAPFLGDMSGVPLNAPVLGSIPTLSGKGYYMVAGDGGIFTFGDAVFAGSMGGQKLNARVEGLVPNIDLRGYWLVASDGGIFAFDAPFRGSMGGHKLNRPVRGMVPFGSGYLMVGEDGGIFNFSGLTFSGSLGASPPNSPVVTVAAWESRMPDASFWPAAG